MFHLWPGSVGQGSSVAVSCGVGHRHGLDLMWLWLCCRLAAVALTGPLAGNLHMLWEGPKKGQKAKKKKKES